MFKYNGAFGYFIEVTARNVDKMGETFIHRQTMANAMRFTTTELGDLARAISEAGDKALGGRVGRPAGRRWRGGGRRPGGARCECT